MYAKGYQKRRVYEGGAVWKTDLQQRGGGICAHRNGIFTGMLLTWTLEPHPAELGESAQAMTGSWSK
jgi:hypothetical protein